MNETIELIHRELDYQASYNGVVAHGETPTDAIENAKKKWQLMEEVERGTKTQDNMQDIQ